MQEYNNNKSHPIFSIILPTYNRSSLLTKAIKSVIHQTFKNWQLIIIDDGSIDDTQKVANVISKKYDNILYFKQENQGRGGVRNTGIFKAQGVYIVFLDDDDYWLPNHLQTFWEKLQQASKNTVIKSEGYLEKSGKLYPLTNYAHSSQKYVIQNIWKIGAQLSSFCFPKVIFNQYQFDPNLFFAQDYHLIMRVILNHNLVFTNKKTFVIVNHPDRGTYKIDETTFGQLYNSRVSIYKYFVEQEKHKLLKYLTISEIEKKAANDYLYLANYAARLGKYPLMLCLVSRSLRLFKMDINILRKLIAVFYQAISNINIKSPIFDK